jgi:hypothetical protein
MWSHPLRATNWHRSAYSEFSGFIVCREHDSASTSANNESFAAQ